MQGIYLVAMNKTVHHPLSMDPAPARHHRTFSAVTMLNLNGNLITERLEIGMSSRIETSYSGLDFPYFIKFVNSIVPGCQVIDHCINRAGQKRRFYEVDGFLCRYSLAAGEPQRVRTSIFHNSS